LLDLVKVVLYTLLGQFSIILELKIELLGSLLTLEIEDLLDYVANLLEVFNACSLALPCRLAPLEQSRRAVSEVLRDVSGHLHVHLRPVGADGPKREHPLRAEVVEGEEGGVQEGVGAEVDEYFSLHVQDENLVGCIRDGVHYNAMFMARHSPASSFSSLQMPSSVYLSS
jgi:hypothetical protein